MVDWIHIINTAKYIFVMVGLAGIIGSYNNSSLEGRFVTIMSFVFIVLYIILDFVEGRLNKSHIE